MVMTNFKVTVSPNRPSRLSSQSPKGQRYATHLPSAWAAVTEDALVGSEN